VQLIPQSGAKRQRRKCVPAAILQLCCMLLRSRRGFMLEHSVIGQHQNGAIAAAPKFQAIVFTIFFKTGTQAALEPK
jgi:hypothetical protein